MASADSLRKGGPIGQGASAGKSDAMRSPGLANTTAREHAEHNSATNSQTKHVTSHKSFGALGGMGHGGSV
jgi:hypothetical protein